MCVVAPFWCFVWQAQDQQYLFFLTRKLCFSVVRYNIVTETFETMAYGDARELAGRIAEGGPLGLVDPLCRMIGMHLHNGALRVAPMDADGTVQEMFSVRFDVECYSCLCARMSFFVSF